MALAAAGWDVHIVLRSRSSSTQLQALGDRMTVHRVGDDGTGLGEAMRLAAPDAVFHLAAMFVAEHRSSDLAPLVQANLLFATQLLEAMRSCGVRLLVNTGTAWQHFGNRDYDPVNLYAATKQAFEAIATYYVNAHGFAVATLVLFDTYGPDDTRPKLMRALWDAASSGAELDMTSGGQLLDLVYIDDVVDAFLAAERTLRDGGAVQRRYGISSGQPLSLRQLVATFEDAVGVRLQVKWGARPDRTRDVFVPWTGFDAPPGWRPRVALRDGLRRSMPPNLKRRKTPRLETRLPLR